MPFAAASATTNSSAGVVTIGASSFGTDLVNGRNRVPRPAAGISALRTRRSTSSSEAIGATNGPCRTPRTPSPQQGRAADGAAARPRRAREPQQLERARRALRVADRRAQCCAAEWRQVAAYLPLRTEPGSPELLAELAGARRPGARAGVAGRPRSGLGGAGAAGRRRRLGRRTRSRAAQAVLVPALAVARDGTRLGRGGGSYDRALARDRRTPVVRAAVRRRAGRRAAARADWDRPVTAAVTPGGWIELPRPRVPSGIAGWP